MMQQQQQCEQSVICARHQVCAEHQYYRRTKLIHRYPLVQSHKAYSLLAAASSLPPADVTNTDMPAATWEKQ